MYPAPPHIQLFPHAKPSIRNGNIELLRFLLMIGICVWHTFVHGFGYAKIAYGEDIQIPFARLFIMCLMVPAVDSFMYISGYYGIRFTISKLIHFWILGVTTVIGCSYFFQVQHPVAYIFPMSSGVWWFMKCYLLIMVVSPIIEKGLENLRLATQIKILLLLLLMNSVIKMLNFQSGGSDFVSLLIIYFIGRFVRLNCIVLRTSTSLLLWTASTFLLFVLALYFNIIGNRINIWLLLGYNNPLVILQSIAIVSFFLSFKPIYNTFFLYLGHNCLSVYLITELLGVTFMYKWWGSLFESSLLVYWVVILLTSLLCIAYSILVNFFTSFVMNKAKNPLGRLEKCIHGVLRNILSEE